VIRRLHQRDRGSGRRHAAGIAVVAALGLAAAASHLFDAEGKSFPRSIDALPGAGERRAS